MAEPKEYPPPGQVLRWLRLTVDNTTPGVVSGTMPVLPEYADHDGNVRMGPVATFVDFVAGILSVGQALPDWVATQDLQVHLTGAASDGALHSTSTISREGKRTIVSETEVRNDADALVAHALVTYAKLPHREGRPAAPVPNEIRDYTDRPEDELARTPMDQLLGFRIDGANATLGFDHPPVLRNSTGAIQGGALAVAMEFLAAAMAEHRFGAPARTTFLHLNYLAAGREPPFEVRGTMLADSHSEALCRLEVVEVPTDRILTQGIARAVVRSA